MYEIWYGDLCVMFTTSLSEAEYYCEAGYRVVEVDNR
jgi:hypothetical protein